MTESPLVPSPLYGLRAWTVAGAAGSERLAGPHRDASWPPGGAWLESTCDRGHAAPASGCDCGIHAWHPRPRWARRAAATQWAVPGVVEASGVIEVHADGFRAQRARPHAMMDVGRHPALVRRLAAAYSVPVLEGGPDELVQWCRARGLGLDEAVVTELLGPAVEQRRRRRMRRNALRMVAVAAAVGLMLALGSIATDPPGDRPLHGRTGEVQGQR